MNQKKKIFFLHILGYFQLKLHIFGSLAGIISFFCIEEPLVRLSKFKKKEFNSRSFKFPYTPSTTFNPRVVKFQQAWEGKTNKDSLEKPNLSIGPSLVGPEAGGGGDRLSFIVF